jgi:hypothetical protein
LAAEQQEWILWADRRTVKMEEQTQGQRAGPRMEIPMVVQQQLV